MFRTSHTHPLHIATIAVGVSGGAVGVTFAPGKFQKAAMTGPWSRDIDLDLCAIRQWGAGYLISLIEPWEFDELRIAALPKRAMAQGIKWYGLPIVDGAAPNSSFLEAWRELGPALSRELLSGSRAVVHCKGGLGRAGTVACLLLLETGAAATGEQAMSMVRQVRTGAIETREQEDFIRAWSPGPGNQATGN
ncbi:protein-tyrosine phosphatase family protein [Stenotrophomonas maltophilia]|uniref:phosphatase domain-containing protein n=1 Tax=Stenotrophomonas maltophilia TaxID=40324 RepID=UPI000D68158D|nr:protein-tyrosine phosphatase family protein [Stenotrophomonas maltophilia]PWI03723.1 protein tyrosine phosphatase [Stenotrophomonas maltophilia]HDS1606905.1 dual specificity protein phosphatase family protein [Stenotrophomonas maltophilia]HDS1638844.1 dual specificity protein phosphatase family protein [Stenotrophomonas maltophilia]